MDKKTHNNVSTTTHIYALQRLIINIDNVNHHDTLLHVAHSNGAQIMAFSVRMSVNGGSDSTSVSSLTVPVAFHQLL